MAQEGLAGAEFGIILFGVIEVTPRFNEFPLRRTK